MIVSKNVMRPEIPARRFLKLGRLRLALGAMVIQSFETAVNDSPAAGVKGEGMAP